MEIRKKSVLVFLLPLLFLFVTCDKLDPAGYFYSSSTVNERVEQSLEKNLGQPSRDIVVTGSEYTLLVAGDSHVGGTENLNLLIEETNSPGVSGLVVVGDLTTGHEEDFITFKQEIDLKLDRPGFLMTGNHDLYFGSWKNFLNYFGSSTYSFKVSTTNSTDLFVCLDSGSGTLGWRQLDWLKTLLKEERNNVRYCILFTHVNFFRAHRTGSTNPLVDELRVIMDLCYAYSINMVFMGHDHNRSEESLGNIRFITLDALADDFENPSYLKLQVKESGLAYVFIEL